MLHALHVQQKNLKQINTIDHPAIIVAGSGMAEGGRVLFHLQHFVSDSKNTILFVGFQVRDTKGDSLVSGAKIIKIRGELYTVKAKIKSIDIFLRMLTIKRF